MQTTHSEVCGLCKVRFSVIVLEWKQKKQISQNQDTLNPIYLHG